MSNKLNTAGVAENNVNDAEIICIVRSRSNPAKKNQIFVLDHVSPDLLRLISQASSDPLTRADLSLRAGQPAVATRPAQSGGPLIRGQSVER